MIIKKTVVTTTTITDDTGAVITSVSDAIAAQMSPAVQYIYTPESLIEYVAPSGQASAGTEDDEEEDPK